MHRDCRENLWEIFAVGARGRSRRAPLAVRQSPYGKSTIIYLFLQFLVWAACGIFFTFFALSRLRSRAQNVTRTLELRLNSNSCKTFIGTNHLNPTIEKESSGNTLFWVWSPPSVGGACVHLECVHLDGVSVYIVRVYIVRVYIWIGCMCGGVSSVVTCRCGVGSGVGSKERCWDRQSRGRSMRVGICLVCGYTFIMYKCMRFYMYMYVYHV